ncbi:MAG TPA: hypothetical protein H9948_04655 [Candidatus Jeotgalibaca merdavium]|uniref:Uncharacterized protein n=1 Tax=Candidatus Jeotgalibaca merdavium TaxID=2838627 RepID=A0A9D2I1W0_9LACT|nr:hypothetical protein [Candidatus Jeotgalibaca merdavium]
MQTKAKIDLKSGTVLDWVLPSDTGLDIIETRLTEPLFKPKWTGKVIEDEEGNQIMGEGEWVEGATQEEIDELTKPQPHEPTVEERLEETERIAQMTSLAFSEYVFGAMKGDY